MPGKTHRHLAGAATSGPPGSCEGDSHAAGRVCVWRLTGGSGLGAVFFALSISGVVNAADSAVVYPTNLGSKVPSLVVRGQAGSREDRVEGTAATRFEEACEAVYRVRWAATRQASPPRLRVAAAASRGAAVRQVVACRNDEIPQ